MERAGTPLRRTSTGGRSATGAALRWRRAAVVAAVAALIPLLACESLPRRGASVDPEAAAQVRANVDSGLLLYASGDYVIAAQRFREAAEGANRCGSLPMERKATTAECTAWLQARQLAELSACTERLEALHRRERRSDPGLNTLLAMGAVAGDRPILAFRVPPPVHPILRAAAKE